MRPPPLGRPLALVLLAACAGSARADEKEICVAASDQAQTLRDDGKFRAARAQLLTCSRDACPSIVRHDCQKWLADLDAAQPTVVLGARDPKGNDFPGTRVILDGAPFVDHLDGKPVAVDPGEHLLRYEAPGASPVEQRVIVRVNEKNRTLTVILMPQASTTPAHAPPATVEQAQRAQPSQPPPADSTASRVPIAAWVFTGVTAAAAVSFAALGIGGQTAVANMRLPPSQGGCAPNCTQQQVDSARTQLIAADVSLGVGIVSLAAAVWFFLHPRAPRATTTGLDLRPDVQARPGGGVATISARF